MYFREACSSPVELDEIQVRQNYLVAEVLVVVGFGAAGTAFVDLVDLAAVVTVAEADAAKPVAGDYCKRQVDHTGWSRQGGYCQQCAD